MEIPSWYHQNAEQFASPMDMRVMEEWWDPSASELDYFDVNQLCASIPSSYYPYLEYASADEYYEPPCWGERAPKFPPPGMPAPNLAGIERHIPFTQEESSEIPAMDELSKHVAELVLAPDQESACPPGLGMPPGLEPPPGLNLQNERKRPPVLELDGMVDPPVEAASGPTTPATMLPTTPVTLMPPTPASTCTEGCDLLSLPATPSASAVADESLESVIVKDSIINGKQYKRVEWRITNFCTKLKFSLGNPLVSPPFDLADLSDLRLMVFPDATGQLEGLHGKRKRAQLVKMIRNGPLACSLKLKAPVVERVSNYYLGVGGSDRRGPFECDFAEQSMHGGLDFGLDWRTQVENDSSLRVSAEIMDLNA